MPSIRPDRAAISVRRTLAAAACALAAVLLSACGGGGGDAPPAPGWQDPGVPVISPQPQDVTVVAGSQYCVSAGVSGATQSYIVGWFDGSGNYVSNNFRVCGVYPWNPYDPPNTYHQLTFQFFAYYPRSVSTAMSRQVYVTVVPYALAPRIDTPPADQTVTAPAAATFFVTASGTNLSYAWESSPDASAPFAALPETGSSLRIDSTTVADSGRRYRVTVTNGEGTSVTSAAALLTVNPTPTAPVIASQPVDVATTAGAGATFSVVASGTPAPAVRWRADGVDLADGAMAGRCNGATASGTHAASLVLLALPTSCSGARFDAVASNGVNPDATSRAALLTVDPAPVAPVLTQQPLDALGISTPSPATFTAAVSGIPTPAVQWQSSSDGGARWTDINGATAPSYTTPATTSADHDKRFRAVFSNVAGSATSNAARLTIALGLALRAGTPGGTGSLDETGTAARFNFPTGAAIDASGNVYVADQYNHTIRKISAAGQVTTLAGRAGEAGRADGVGAAARFAYPAGVAVGADGTVYVADLNNLAIRKITQPDGTVSTLNFLGIGTAPNSLNYPRGVAVDFAGNVYVANTGSHTILKMTPAGVVSTHAGLTGISGTRNGTGSGAQFNAPSGIVSDPAGNLYVADTGNGAVRRITSNGDVTTLAGTAGVLGSTGVDGVGPAARFVYAASVAIGAGGDVLVGDSGTVRRITADGTVSTLAGASRVFGNADGAGPDARFSGGPGVAADAAGSIVVADGDNPVMRRIVASGSSVTVSTWAGAAGVSGSADGAAGAARFKAPLRIASDAAGVLYVVDVDASTLRRISPSGIVSTLAGLADNSGAADGAGVAARFSAPAGVAVDAAGGRIYVSDSGNQLIRRVTPSGVVDTLAGASRSVGSTDGSNARFKNPGGLAVDIAGNVFVADSGNHTIRRITPAGLVSTIAGSALQSGSADGVGSAARFDDPVDVAVDGLGNVYVVDRGNQAIRRVAPDGMVTTLAGTIGQAGSADGIGSVAQFRDPFAIAVGADAAGQTVVYVADRNNHTVRKLAPVGARWSVSTVVGAAGEGGIRLGRDGRLAYPSGVAVLGPSRLAITSGRAVLGDNLP